MRRLTCTAIASLALAVPAAAQVSDNVVKIGVLTDMSGPFSDQTGRGSIAGAELAIEDFKGTVAGSGRTSAIATGSTIPARVAETVLAAWQSELSTRWSHSSRAL